MSEPRGAAAKQYSGYTVVGIVEDGVALNRAIAELRELEVSGEDLTAIVKRRDPDGAEPFPEGTRYIIVPDDFRGLEIPIAFAAIFVVASLLFAFTAPGIGTMVFVFFSTMAAILAAGVFTSVGVDPILMQMQVSADEAGQWNEEFEKGKALVFASTDDRHGLRPLWEALKRQGADFYVIEQRLQPEPTSGATLHWAGGEESQERAAGSREAQSQQS